MYEISLDAAQQFIINKLHEANKKALLHFGQYNSLADRGYDVCFSKTLAEFTNSICPYTSLTAIDLETKNQVEKRPWGVTEQKTHLRK